MSLLEEIQKFFQNSITTKYTLNKLKNMEIKTITCHDVNNYGASLQAFALQTYLSSLGHDVKIIDYLPKYLCTYNIWKLNTESRIYKVSKYFPPLKLLGVLKNFIHFYPTRKRVDKFTEFKNIYLKLTKHYSTYKGLLTDPPSADILIVGSDQVWNTLLPNGKDFAFFLQFGDLGQKRISYAASFGISYIDNNYSVPINSFLKNFNAISIRGTSGLNILNSMKINGELVCDPVCLLSKNEWIKYLHISRRSITEKYLLIYDIFGDNPNIEILAKKFSKEHNVKIVAINNIKQKKYADININDGGPIEFVELISNAEFVIADSFHATAFSTILHVPFAVFYNRSNISRISDYLTFLDLNDRLNPQELNLEINWELVSKKITSLSNKSKLFLDKSINL